MASHVRLGQLYTDGKDADGEHDARELEGYRVNGFLCMGIEYSGIVE